MIKKLTYIALLVTIFSVKGYSQNFILSNKLTSNALVRTAELKKVGVDNGFIVYGDFTGTLNVPASNIANGRDVFLAKYDDNFNLLWLQQIGGTLIDWAYDIAIHDNYIYIVGTYKGTCTFDGGSEELTAVGSNFDAFLAKYKLDGTFVWAKPYAYNNAIQYATAIAVDKFDDLLIGGYYSDSITFESDKFISANGMFFSKVDSSGTFLWAENIITNSTNSKILAISAYNDGYYLTGNFVNSATFDLGGITSNNASYSDVFLYKTDFNGTGLWLRRSYGYGSADTKTGTITNDDYGNIYYTGLYGGSYIEVDSTDVLKSNKDLTNNGSLDAFIFKYNKDGNLIWNFNYGNKGEEWARDIFYRNGFLYLAGYFSDTLFLENDTLVSGGPLDYDAMLGMFDSDGNLLRVAQIEDTNDGTTSGVALGVDDENNAYWGGDFKASQITIGDSIFTRTGTQSIFFSKYKPSFTTAFTYKKNVTCNGGNNGQLIITPYFGVPPFNYTWSHDGGLNDSTATNLVAGNYKVTVTDALDSSNIIQYTVTQPKPFIFNPNITQVATCSYSLEGAINLNVSGGNSGKTYLWIESEGGSGVQLTSEDQTSLAIGRYDVTVTDSKSCTADTTIYITGPDPVVFNGTNVTDDSGVDPIHNGAIDLTLIGGTGTPGAYAAAWTGPSGFTALTQDIASLNSGLYNVSILDGNGCAFDSSFTVLDLDTLFAYTSAKKDDCTGGAGDGTATVSYYTPNPTPVISYLWSTGGTSATVTGLVPGMYYVTVTESDSAWTYVDSVQINDLGYTIAGNLAGTTSVNCKGDSDGYIDLTITTPGLMPYAYNWTSGQTSQDITGLMAGTYGVTVTDDNSCTLILSGYDITEPTLDLTALASIENEPLCNGDYNGEIKVDANGGTAPYTYQWDDPGYQTSQIATGLDVNLYNVTVTDFNGCIASDNVNLTQPEILSVSDTIISNLLCFENNSGAIDITVSGGSVASDYSYLWSSGATTQDLINLMAGTYILTVTDDNSCEIIETYVVSEPPVLEITDTSNVDISTCNGDNTGTIVITAVGGTGILTYTLNPGATQVNNTGIFAGLTGGVYTVEVTDENLCGPVTSDPIQISEPSAIVITETAINDATCNGLTDGSIDITVSGGTVSTVYTYNWATSDGSGLVASAEDQTGLGAGTYDLTVTDDNLCTATTSILISEPNVITIAETTVNDITCNGLTDGSIDITVSGGTVSTVYTYNWATSDGSGLVASAEDQIGLGAGTYDLTVTDDNLCTATTSILISEPNVITIDETTVNDITCNGLTDGSIDITVSGGTVSTVYTYNWATSDGSGLVASAEDQTGLGAGTYDLTVTDDNLCTANTSIGILEPLAIVIDSEDFTDATGQTIADGTITITASGGTGNITYNLNPGNLSNQTGAFTALLPDDYTVELTDDNSCGPISSNVITVGFPDAVENIFANDFIEIYPNPTSDKIFVEFYNNEDDVNLQIITPSGQILFNKEIKSKGFTKEEIDLSNYSKGFYFIRVYNNRFNINNKILLQ